MRNAEKVFKFLVKECHLSVDEYGDLNDAQIQVLCSEDK
jgi:hypothetical protein